MPYASDGVFSKELLIERINGDLVNILGNLVNRTVSMAHKYFDGKIEVNNVSTNEDQELLNMVSQLDKKVTEKMDELQIGLAIDEIFEVLKRCNKYIDETTPWVLAKDSSKKERLQTVLYNLLESIRVCAVYLQTFLPDTAAKIFAVLNTDSKNIDDEPLKLPVVLNNPIHLFDRIEEK